MKLTLKAKLEVDEAQHRVLDRMAFACTKLWNTANYEQRRAWEKTGKIPSYVQQCRRLKDNPWARLLQSQSAQAVLQKLDFAYRSWYKLHKIDKTAKPPGFRRKESLSTITFKRSAFRIEGNQLRLSLTPKLRGETGFEGREPAAKVPPKAKASRSSGRFGTPLGKPLGLAWSRRRGSENPRALALGSVNRTSSRASARTPGPLISCSRAGLSPPLGRNPAAPPARVRP